MKEISSPGFKRYFLLLFTKELIRHSVRRDILKLQNIIEKEEKSKVILPVKLTSPARADSSMQLQPKPVRQLIRQTARRPLFIPEPKLPAHLEYLKPVPAPRIEIDLDKLNPFIRDPAVRIMEGNPDDRIIVTGTMGTKPTDVVLNKEDIERIINKFSEVSKIPVNEGVYRVVVGNLILSAIISEVIGSRFTIRKMR